MVLYFGGGDFYREGAKGTKEFIGCGCTPINSDECWPDCGVPCLVADLAIRNDS
jgi:hypothetical protein